MVRTLLKVGILPHFSERWSYSCRVTAPIRIQRSRAKGARLSAANGPADCSASVAPVVGATHSPAWLAAARPADKPSLRAESVAQFRRALLKADGALPFTSEDVRRELRGKNLACWCPSDQPCHADVLLEVANVPPLSPSPSPQRD